MEFLIGLGCIAIIGGFVAVGYNRMVVLRNTFKNALSQIDVVLKQRHDVIPALVNVVKGYAAHEAETLEAVIAARNAAEGARKGMGEMPSSDQVAAVAASETALSAGLGRFFALAEAYPDLKASTHFQELQVEIRRIEEKVAAARRGYNMTVLEYNNGIETFPANILAKMFGFLRASELDFATAQPEIQDMPKVEF
jgi:LemA protein